MIILLIFVVLLIPVTMIVISGIWMIHPPKEINDFSGYRTKMSMKNQDTWDFAHKYICRIFFWTSIILLIISIFLMLIFRNSNTETFCNVTLILIICQTVGICIPIIPTEHALKKNFDKDGNRRN